MVQTMLTVGTQNSRLLRRSAFSGDRMAVGFGYAARPSVAAAQQCLLYLPPPSPPLLTSSFDLGWIATEAPV